MQKIKVITTTSVCYSLLKVGSSIWCGAERDIIVYDSKDFKKTKELDNHHDDPITGLMIVWDRIVWSSSLDQSICIWS